MFKNVPHAQNKIWQNKETRLQVKYLRKGYAQFSFLCNPPKSGASQVYITFLQVTQKILTKDTFHWLEVITEIPSFLQIFSVRKTTTQFFLIFPEIYKKIDNKNYIPGIFWAFKSKLQIIPAATYVVLFYWH